MTIIKKRNRWDGLIKLLTKDCYNCEFYKKIKEKELCGIGESFKYLVATQNPKRCEVKDRKEMYSQGKNPSINYLNLVEEEKLFTMKIRQLNLFEENIIA
jgi:hypothetical protein